MKYIVCDRRGGLGDIFANIYSSWIIAKQYNRGLIIDCRETPYNWFESVFQGMNHIPINAFECIFLPCNNVGGVKCYLPTQIEDYMFRPTSKNYWSKDDLPVVKSSDQINIPKGEYISEKNSNLLNSSIKFLRTDIIFYNHLAGLNSFLNNFKLNNTIKDKINKIKEKYDFTNTCGFHIRYGNNSETTNPTRFPGWKSISSIFEDLDSIMNNISTKYNNFFICSDTQLIIDKFKNRYSSSFNLSTNHGNYGDPISLLNPNLCPISLIQDAFIDMYFLQKCKYAYLTDGSMFTVPVKNNIPVSFLWNN